MRKQYIQPLCSVIEHLSATIMTHVSGGLIHSTEQEDNPVKAW